MTGSRPCHANHSVSIQNRFVTKHDKAMFLGAVPCEVPPKPHTKYVISMGIKHAVPLGNLDCKDFAGLPVVAVCAMGVCWSPDVLLGLSWFRVGLQPPSEDMVGTLGSCHSREPPDCCCCSFCHSDPFGAFAFSASLTSSDPDG